MPAYITDNSKRWGQYVPYVFKDNDARNEWIETKISELNNMFTRPIFKQRENEDDYVEIDKGSNSPIGKQGGKQVLNCSTDSESRKGGNLYHEMGHCMGLGHTYFHTGCTNFTGLFENLDKTTFDNEKGKYSDYGLNYVDSMMVYSPGAFINSPRIQRVIKGCNNDRTKLNTFKNDLSTLKQKRTAIETADFRGKFTITAGIPNIFKRIGINLKYENEGYKEKKIVDSNILAKLIKTDIDEFISDIDNINNYWIFDGINQNMKVTEVDKVVIKFLFNIS